MITGLPLISVVIPVKNEGAILGRCLESLKSIDYPNERLEIIISDGMSADDTRAVASKNGAKVVPNDGEIVVTGRNRGFEQSTGELVAFTDADCIFDKGWLRNSLKYFDDASVGGVGGLTLPPEYSSGFEEAADFIFHLAEIFRSTAHRKALPRAEETDDIPGCNAIYRREALGRVMPVDEGLLTAEDVWMNFCVRRAGYKLMLAPDVVVRHYRRSSPARFLRQVYRFAVGRMQVVRKDAVLLRPLHVAAIFLAPVAIPFILALMPAAFIKTKSIRAVANVPLAAAIFIFGWSAGFLREFFAPMNRSREDI